ncbi:helix-turn-helix domain-containing protein [Sphingobium yanoikuyae]|uniref:helix-turn-helix domain-containing protein n=1 Tax=Sphingobium yanoikuyae TaxID=13690 RepID=UPI003B920387
MKDEDFDGIMAGLNDALAYAKGDLSRGTIVSGPDVKAIRVHAKKTQKDFANTYRIPIGTVRDWEQGRRQPDAPARVLLSIIKADPAAVEKLLEKA